LLHQNVIGCIILARRSLEAIHESPELAVFDLVVAGFRFIFEDGMFALRTD
jgi:hypothetical protein